MNLLLDTHALLWWFAYDDRLGPNARAMIANPGNDILVSVVSLWEIVVKLRVGKLRADLEEIMDAIQRQGLALLAIDARHLLTLAGLPMHHRDPFDHLLIAQAIAEQAILVSEDQGIRKYPLRVVTCRDQAPAPSGC